MGIVGSFVKSALFGTVVGLAAYNIGSSAGYGKGVLEGREEQRYRDYRIVSFDREQTAARLERATMDAYTRLRTQMQDELTKEVDLSDERYEDTFGLEEKLDKRRDKKRDYDNLRPKRNSN